MVELMKLRLGDKITYGGGARTCHVRSLRLEGDNIVVNSEKFTKDGQYVLRNEFIDITAIHPVEPAADGWVDFGVAKCKRFGELLAVVDRKSYVGFIGGCPEWIDPTQQHTPEEIDAAYARHCEPKPVLVWDDDEHCSRSHSGDATYLVTSTRTENDKRWFAHLVDRIAQVSPLVGGFGYSKRDEAKAACERHARGE